MISDQTIKESQEFEDFIKEEFLSNNIEDQAIMVYGDLDSAIAAFKESECWEFFHHCNEE